MGGGGGVVMGVDRFNSPELISWDDVFKLSYIKEVMKKLNQRIIVLRELGGGWE